MKRWLPIFWTLIHRSPLYFPSFFHVYSPRISRQSWSSNKFWCIFNPPLTPWFPMHDEMGSPFLLFPALSLHFTCSLALSNGARGERTCEMERVSRSAPLHVINIHSALSVGHRCPRKCEYFSSILFPFSQFPWLNSSSVVRMKKMCLHSHHLSIPNSDNLFPRPKHTGNLQEIFKFREFIHRLSFFGAPHKELLLKTPKRSMVKSNGPSYSFTLSISRPLPFLECHWDEYPPRYSLFGPAITASPRRILPAFHLPALRNSWLPPQHSWLCLQIFSGSLFPSSPPKLPIFRLMTLPISRFSASLLLPGLIWSAILLAINQ